MNKAPRGVRLASSILCATLIAATAVVGVVSAQPQDEPQPEVFGGPLANLTEQQLSDFLAGEEEFQKVFKPEMGLGPIFCARKLSGQAGVIRGRR